MKYYFFLVLLYSIIYIQAEDDTVYGFICSTYTSDNDCHKLSKKESIEYCCVLKAITNEDNQVKRCLKLDPAYVEQGLEEYKSQLIEEKNLKEASIDCGFKSEAKPETESDSRSDTRYLKLGIFSLLFLIITL